MKFARLRREHGLHEFTRIFNFGTAYRNCPLLPDESKVHESFFCQLPIARSNESPRIILLPIAY